MIIHIAGNTAGHGHLDPAEFLTCDDEETGGGVPGAPARHGGGTARNAGDHGPARPDHAAHAEGRTKAQVKPLVPGKSD